MMNKGLIWTVSGLLLLSSCGTYTGTGAYVGGQFGTILGSAIGGISGGPRGADIGTIVGMAGGAVVGAAIGSAADRAQQERIEAYQQQRSQRSGATYGSEGYGTDGGGYAADDSGFDATNSGDDRITFDGAGPRDGQGQAPGYDQRRSSTAQHGVEIRNARLIDSNGDGVISAGEECKVTFEIMNRTGHPLYDVQPMILDVTGNKHIHISPNLHVESIAPNSGVRYTGTVKADSRLKDGTARIQVGVALGSDRLMPGMKEFTVVTRRR